MSTNAVRSRPTVLERDSVVDQGGVRRESVGKPARIYRLSVAGEELFARAYAPMLLAFLDLLGEWHGTEGLTEVLRALDADVTSDQGDGQVMLVVSGCPLPSDQGCAA